MLAIVLAINCSTKKSNKYLNKNKFTEGGTWTPDSFVTVESKYVSLVILFITPMGQ
jgi:hypothetical protein